MMLYNSKLKESYPAFAFGRAEAWSLDYDEKVVGTYCDRFGIVTGFPVVAAATTL